LIAFDSNILVYAQQDADGQDRHHKALYLIYDAAKSAAIIPMQVLGEFLNVCRTKLGKSPKDAVDQVADYMLVFECPATGWEDLTDAAYLADSFNLQFFDALIVTVAARAGATVLLTEDMHDGLRINDLTVINPFNPANATMIVALLAASG
jgi:predicted nucleic acid-binding protein